MAEELGIEIEPDELTWLSFGANSYLCEYGLIGRVDTGWTAARIDARRSTGAAKDNWETKLSTRGGVQPGSAWSGPPRGPPPPLGSGSSHTGVAPPVSACRAAVCSLPRVDSAMQGHGGRYVVTTSVTGSRRAFGAHTGRQRPAVGLG
jgi:hypothetical protein